MGAPDALGAEIRRLIQLAGPMPVSEFMALCLGHPQYGYYMAHEPFGTGGDFTTSPEISQMFGELLGLWAAAVWRQMGAPAQIDLVELRPSIGFSYAFTPWGSIFVSGTYAWSPRPNEYFQNSTLSRMEVGAGVMVRL